MRVGLMPGLVSASDRRPFTYSHVLELARAAEEGGLHSFWLADHLLYREPGEPDAGPMEAWTVLSALAAATARIRLGPMVAAAPFRKPALLAKMAVTLHEVSDGRLVLGVGAGVDPVELEAFGLPSGRRVDRFEEALQILAPLLKQGEVSFEGRYHRAIECRLIPAPPPGGIDLLVGGKGPRLLSLAARHADAWNGYWLADADEVRTHLERLAEACRAEERPIGELRTSITTRMVLDELPGGDEPIPSGAIRGSRPELAERLAALADTGLDEVVVRPVPQSRQAVEELARLAEVVAD